MTSRPSKRDAGCAQETTALPSTSTVQAPHEPSGAQPSLAEVTPHPSRSSVSRVAPSATGTVIAWPFSTNSMTPPIGRR